MFRQLLRKELHLQRSNLFFVLAVVMVWGVLAALAPQGERDLIEGRLKGELVSFLQLTFVGTCLLAVIPLMIGATMAAEERKLGVWDWHLSLPASRGFQWTVKLAVGAVIVLAISLVLQPLLDTALLHLLSERGDRVPLPISLLAYNPAYSFLPLLLMASGAFVSSLSSDPYKAFFLGALPFVFIAGCLALADPAWQVLLPWDPKEQAFLRNHPAPIALIVALGATLGYLASFNFRYEAFRRRRFAAAVVTLAVVTIGGSLLALQWEFGLAGRFTRSKEKTEKILQQSRELRGLAPKTVSWNGIDPLLVPRFSHSFLGKKPIPLAGDPILHLLSSLYRLPGTNRVLAVVDASYLAIKQGATGNSFESDLRVVEVDVVTGDTRSLALPFSGVVDIFPADSTYAVASHLSPRKPYLITRCPVPLSIGGILWKLTGRKVPAIDLGQPNRGIPPNANITVDGKTIRWNDLLYPVAHDYYRYFNGKPTTESGLLLRLSKSTFARVDTQSGYKQYAVSPDGKWFTRSTTNLTWSDPKKHWENMEVFATDHSTTRSIDSKGGQVILDISDTYSFLSTDSGRAKNTLGYRANSSLPVSPNGRFLAFHRLFSSVPKKPADTREVGILDLQTGIESILCQLPLYLPGSDVHVPDLFTTIWSKDRDRLAILYNTKIYLFDFPSARPASSLSISPENAQSTESTPFVRVGEIDLFGFAVTHCDFWDANTLLVWGDLGLFRIDIAKACGKQAASN